MKKIWINSKWDILYVCEINFKVVKVEIHDHKCALFWYLKNKQTLCIVPSAKLFKAKF